VSAAWADRLITVDQLIADASDGVGEAARALHHRQIQDWPRLAEASTALDAVRIRELKVGERNVLLQWNPGRRASTTARVDTESRRRRPCFLCDHNLPPEQKGVAFGANLILMANPAPILPLHYTVVHRRHIPQALAPVLADAIRLSLACAGVMTVFYNGPRCGASAPDHLHLQAAASGRMPDERELTCRLAGRGRAPVGRVLVQRPGLGAWCNRESSRTVLIFSGSVDNVEKGLRAAVDTLVELDDRGEEPPLNLLLWAEGTLVTAMLYARGAHRPSCYFAEGADRCLVSPGAIDMAGLVITVRREDFQRLDESLIGQIYRETSLDPGLANELEKRLCQRLKAVQ